MDGTSDPTQPYWAAPSAHGRPHGSTQVPGAPNKQPVPMNVPIQHQTPSMWGGVGARGGSGGRHDPNRVSERVLGPLEVPRSNRIAIRQFCGGKPRPPGTPPTPFQNLLIPHLRYQEGPVGRARSHTAGCLPLQNTPMAKRFQGPKPTGGAPPENHHFQTPTLPPG